MIKNRKAFLAFTLAFLVGVGKNMPFQALYPFGIAPIEWIMAFVLFYQVLKINTGSIYFYWNKYLKHISILIFLLSILIFISYVVNLFYFDSKIKDLFEILRYILNIYLIIIVLYFHKYYETLIQGFVIGIIFSVLIGFFSPNNPSVDIGSFSIPQVYNPNVLGVLIGFSIFLVVILELQKPKFINIFFIIILSFLSAFTFSKASWLIVILGLLSYSMILFSTHPIKKIYYFFLLLLIVFFLWYFNFFTYIIDLIIWKLAATSFESSASEGGSFSARVGLIMSGIYMFLENPLFGIGISNFEYFHNKNESLLNDAFYPDDNPNSAFIYILSCAGIFPFIVWNGIIFYTIYLIYKLFMTKYGMVFSILQAFLFSLVIVLSGLVQNEILNAHFYWYLIALLIIKTKLNKVHIV